MRNSVVNEDTVAKIRAMLAQKEEEVEGEEINGMSPEVIQSIRMQLRAEMGSKLDNVTEDSLLRLLMNNVEHEKSGPKSRAHYRVAATRSAFGSKKVKAGPDLDTVAKIEDAGPDTKDLDKQPACEFVTSKYSCLEGCGEMVVRVIRTDNSLEFPASVKYTTRGSPSAQPGKDYVEASGTLEFDVQEAFKDVTITIIDNDIVEDDKVFHVDLSEPRCTTGDSKMILGECATCAVTIIDDDDPGALDFPKPQFVFVEGVDEEAVVPVVRRKGGSGKVWCEFETEEILQDDCNDGEEPAEHEKNFEMKTEQLDFMHNQSNGTIKIPIVNSGSQDKFYKFRVVIKNPGGEPNAARMDINTTGLPRDKGTMNLDHCSCEVIVQSDPQMAKRNQDLMDGMKAAKEDEKISSG